MGEKILRKIRGMSWAARISLMLTFTVMLSIFMFQGWYNPLLTEAAPTTDGRIVYSNNTTTPQHRSYTASTNTFGAAAAMQTGAAQTFMVDRASAIRNEHIAGYVTTAGVLYILRWNGTAWSNEWNVTVGGTGVNGRRFDIAYEGISEDVIVVYSTNSTNPEMQYRVWNGSTWTAATNLDSARIGNVVNWVKMASRPGSDEIALAFSDTGRSLSSFIWNGSAWGNEPGSAHTTNLSRNSTAGDYDTFDLAYESSSGDLMVVWGDSTSIDPRYRTYSGGTWSGTAEVTNQDKLPAHLDLASDPLSDRIILGYNVDADTRFFGSVWSGSSWSTARRLDSDTGQSSRTPTANHKEISVAFLNSGATRVGIVAFNNSSTTGRVDIAYTTNDGGSFAWNSFSPSPTPGYEAWMDIQVDPVSNDTMMLTFSDNNSDLFAKRLVINSTPTFTWTNSDGGSALFNSLPNLTSKNFSFAYNRYPATVVGNGTNPTNTSLCPGGAATMLDAFTLQTSLGTDTITNVTVTLAPTGSFNNMDLIEITDDAGNSVYGSATNPAADAVTITTTGLSATTTLTQYKVRITPKSHINMPVPPGASYAITGTVTALTSTDIKIYSDITSATVTIDNLSPNNPTAFSGTPGSTKVSLIWTNPVDADFSQVVVLRKSVSAVTDKPSEGESYIVGDTIGASTVACVVNTPGTTCTDTGLINGTAYYYKIFAKDSCGNYSSGGTAAGPYTPSAATVGNGTNPGNSFAGPSQTNKNADSFTLKTDTGACTVTGLVVTGTNTANVAASGVKIYQDNGATPNAWDATDTLITNGTASFSGSTATFTGLSISVTTSSVQYIVAYNIVASPTNGQTLTGTVTDITTTCDKMLSDTAGSTITIDAVGPTDGTLTATPASSTGIDLSWTAATDSGSGLAAANTYKVVRATGAAAPADCTGTAIYQGTALLYNDTGLTPSTQYAYRVCAYDSVSNVSTGATASATTAAAGTAKTYYVNALSATNVGYDGTTNMTALGNITVTGGLSNVNRAYTNNTAPSGTTKYTIMEGSTNTRTNQEYFRAYTPKYTSATSIEANATAYANFYMATTGTSVTAKAFLYEYNDTTGVVGTSKGTASYTGNAGSSSLQTMNNVSFNNTAFTVTANNRLMVIFAFNTTSSRPAYLWGQAASATPSGYQAITVKESTLIVPPVEVSGSLAVTPEYSAFVGSPFTITEDFTSTTVVNSCQYTINGGGLWSAGVVSGTGPYTCTASGVTAANGTALTIRMRASNDAGSTWSTVSASLSRTVDSAGPTNGTLTASPASSTQINLSWSGFTDAGSGLRVANTYKLVSAAGATPPADCTGEAIYLGTELSYNDTGLTPSTQYSYRVCAYDNMSNVSTGATASATTLAPDNKTTTGAMTFPNVTSNWIQVQVAFTGDDNGNNSCVIKWGTSSGNYPNTAPAPTRSPLTGSGAYTTTVSGLSATTTYYFQATFSDVDTVSGTNPVLGSMITTPAASDADLLHNSNRFACSKQGYDTSATCTSAGGTWNPNRKWTGGWGITGAQYGAIDCYTCHTRTTGNIKRIKQAITASSGTFPGSNVAFTNTKGNANNGFGNDAGGHATSTEVCEVCHGNAPTKSMYHNYNTANNDPTPDFGLVHHNESDCVLCHPHNQGFRGVVNTCITCHNKVQKPDAPYNVRRDVTSASGDLSKTSHHIVSATPDEGSCMICHKHAGSTDPAVKMLDPDAADTTIAYDGTAASLTPFCWNCHDSNGANRLAATGPTPAQKDYPLAIKTKPYADSGDNTTPPNVKTEYNKTYGHGNNGGIGTIGAECMDCHGDSAYDGTTLKPQKNAHGSGVKKMLNEPGTTYGLAMFSVCTNGSCHNTGDAFGVGDVEFEFRTTNQAYHPVRGALPATDPGPNGSSRLEANQLAGGWCSKTGYYTSATCTAAGGTWTAWAPGATMTCVDCHNTDASPTAAQGPHGSSLKWMLAGVNKAWPYQGAANNGKSSGTYWQPGNMTTNNGTSNGLFCLNCHSLSGNKHSTLIAEDSDHDVACVQCHIRVPHGGKSSRFQADFGSTPMPARYYPNGNGGGFTTGMIQIKKGDYTLKENCYTNCGKHDTSIGGEEW